MTAYILAAVGFALCFYGLSPLSGSEPRKWFVSERGAITCFLGIAILVMVGCVKVLS